MGQSYESRSRLRLSRHEPHPPAAQIAHKQQNFWKNEEIQKIIQKVIDLTKNAQRKGPVSSMA